MFKNFLKIAWRNLLKNRTTSFINIAGLAIGMAVAITIGLWIEDELTYNKGHQNYDSLAQVMMNQTFNGQTGTGQAISLPQAPALRDNFGSNFENISLASWNFQHLLTYGEKRFLKDGMYVEPQFAEMFTLDMISGNQKESLKKTNAIILNESFAKALFDDEDPIGKTIKFDSFHDLEVTGVFKDLPRNSEFYTSHYFVAWEFMFIQQEWTRNALENWGNHSFQMYAQIKESGDFEAISAKIRDIEKPHGPRANPEIFLFPMSKWHLFRDFENGINVGGRIKYVWLFGIIGIFVLLLACINFMNLSTARSEKRAKEVGIRKSIGSQRGQLIKQFLSESVMVTFIAMILAVFLVQLALPSFNELADKSQAIPWTSPLFWFLLVGFSLLTGLLAGSYPAFYLSSFQPLEVLKGSFKAGKGAAIPRKFLVTLQFTVSIALIISTIAVFQQIQHAKQRQVGYERDGLIQFMNNAELDGKFDVLREEMKKTGAVIEMSSSSGPITNIWSNQSDFEWDEKDPELTPSFGTVAISAEFGKTIDWEIIDGRDFSREISTDTLGLILNESAVKLVGVEDIVGKTIRWDEYACHVIGVVKDMLMESPWEPVKPTIFHLNTEWVNVYTLRLRPGQAVKEALTKVEQVFSELSPSSPFEYKFVDEDFGAKFEAEERIGKLGRIFAILAIFISCLGLYGLSAFVAEQRTKEIGIRKVLGASVSQLWAMQSKGFLGLVFLACFIASPIAWYFLNQWLNDYDYRIQLGWEIFVVSALVAILVTLTTVSFQTIRAALANPVEALKSE